MIKVLHIKKLIWKHEHAIYVYKSVKSHILFLNKKLNQLTSRCSRAEIRYADGLLLLRGLHSAEITDTITAPEPCSQRQPFSSEAVGEAFFFSAYSFEIKVKTFSLCIYLDFEPKGHRTNKTFASVNPTDKRKLWTRVEPTQEWLPSHRQSSSRNSNIGAEPQRPASESYLTTHTTNHYMLKML